MYYNTHRKLFEWVQFLYWDLYITLKQKIVLKKLGLGLNILGIIGITLD